MLHTSTAFPSHLVLLLEAGGLCLLLLIAAALPARGRDAGLCTLRLIRRLAPRGMSGPRLALLAATVGLLAAAATTALLGGFPIAGCPDEHAYLLAAETFAEGRLTNPPVEHPGLVGQHCLARPVHQSKYFPGQSLSLLPGVVLGQPGLSLWLHTALLVGAAALCFRSWMPTSWAVVGVLLVLLRLGVGSYWNHTYWGGSVAAAGGFLAWAGGARLLRRPESSSGALMLSIGAMTLAGTRPFEGMLSLLPLGVALALELRRLPLRRLVGSAAILALVGGSGLAALAGYNQAITGSPLRTPHELYADTTSLPGEFVWQRWGADGRLHWYEDDLVPTDDLGWIGAAAQLLLQRAAKAPYFLVGPALCVALLMAAASLVRTIHEPATTRRLPLWPAAVAVATVLLGHASIEAYFPHYSAPIAAPLWLLALAALRRLVWRPPAVARWSPALLPIALVLQIPATALQQPAFRHDPDDIASIRVAVTRRLEQVGGRHLVLVAAGHGMAVANPPLPLQADVIWAIDAGDDATRRLLAAVQDRRLWLWRGELGGEVVPLDPEHYLLRREAPVASSADAPPAAERPAKSTADLDRR